jgi:acetylornithine deacetylase/succinyl-diaminopimelate desuccinylase-like protein
MADFTPYQQKIIKRYYDNQDLIQSQRLAELVSELYLAEGKKRERAWKAIVAALEKLGVPQSRIEHVRKQDNPALVAEIVKEIQKI